MSSDMLMKFLLEGINGGPKPISLDVSGVVLCGYTGRDQDAVKRHIDELAEEGIAPPPSVPMYYPKPAAVIGIDTDITVEGRETSGEVEFVLFPAGDSLYVGLGSDHTDRELERLDIRKSKQICPSVVSRALWDYNEIKDHWDQIEIRSWAVRGGERIPYQEATVSILLSPEELLERVRREVHSDVDGLSIYSGTPPLTTGEFVYAERFEAEMYDPVRNKRISLSYKVRTLDWFRS